VKADGLAAGKGVVVCRTSDELEAGLDLVRGLGDEVVVEELLEGPEVSVLAICDGVTAVPLPPAQDFKRAYDGDEGPNTGGMGSYAPVPGLTASDLAELVETVHVPVLEELARRGTPFVGTLFAGLMLTAGGPKVLEFNCRFGDPETQSVLPLLDGDLLAALGAAAAGELAGVSLPGTDEAAVTVALTAGDYPAGADRGSPIGGVESAESLGALVFHAGTALRDGRLVTNGGRILNVTATGSDLASARSACYAAVERISCPGARYRGDIARLAAAGTAVSLRS
jgi:phosphoribosylamine--glycine ligase